MKPSRPEATERRASGEERCVSERRKRASNHSAVVAPQDPLDPSGPARDGASEARARRYQRRSELAELRRELVRGDNAVGLGALVSLATLVWFGGGWLGWIEAFDRRPWVKDTTTLAFAIGALAVITLAQVGCALSYRRSPWLPAFFSVLLSIVLMIPWLKAGHFVLLFQFLWTIPSIGTDLWDLYERESRPQGRPEDGELLETRMFRREKHALKNALDKARARPNQELVAVVGTLAAAGLAWLLQRAGA